MRQFAVPARAVHYDADGNRWEAVLGSFPAGVIVSYRFDAEIASGEHVAGGHHSFETAGWHCLATVISWEARRTQALICLSDKEDVVSTLSIGFPAPGELCLRVWPLARAAWAELHGGLPCSARVDDHSLIVEGGGLVVRIGLKNGALSVEALDGSGPALPVSSGNDPLLAWLGARPDCPRAVRLRLSLLDDEALYGSGERFDRFDRRGLRFDMRVYEQYKNQGSRTYLPVPLLLSSRGYALSVEGTRPLEVKASASDVNRLDVAAEVKRDESACLEATIFLATAPLAALEAYLHHAGLPAMPPDWAFGLWMSANDWNSQERVLAEVERAEHEDIPADVVVIEAWSDETTFYIWNNAQYGVLPAERPPQLADFSFPSDGHWPDPKRMIDELHAKGIRLLLWQIPLMSPTRSSLSTKRPSSVTGGVHTIATAPRTAIQVGGFRERCCPI
jgi:hypothetical protein